MNDLITVDLHLFASLHRSPGGSHQILELRPRTSVRDVVERLALPEMEIHLVFVNGRVASLDQMLQDGDRLALFPPIGGG
jgi:molybdopterin converting factor small subunit